MLALFAWLQRAQVDTPPALMLFGNALWLFGFGAATGTLDFGVRVFWAKFQFLGAGILFVGLISLTMAYAGYARWLTRRNRILVALMPLTGALLAWTNEAHHLIWIDVQPSIYSGISLLSFRYGAFFWFYLGFYYLALAFSIFCFAKKFRSTRGIQRKQAAILLSGTLFPLMGNLIYLSGVSPIPTLDLTLPGLTLMSIIFFWGFMSNWMLGLSTVSRTKALEYMPDPVAILDMRDRVIDLNRAALSFLGLTRVQALGCSLQQLIPHEVEMLRKYQNSWDLQEVLQFGPPDAPLYYSLSITPLYDWRNHLCGRMTILRDTTDLHLREIAIKEARDHLEVLNQRLVAEMASREMAQNQVFEQQRLLAVMEVRERLARDLHDNLGQVLGFFNMQVAAARQYLRDLDLSASDALLASIAEVALSSQLELRDTIRELKSPGQIERRFFPSLDRQIARFEQNYNIRVAQEIDPTIKQRGFDSNVSTQRLNILQESLNNIAKHASASTVRMVISQSPVPSQAEIVMLDDGKGFLPTDGTEERSHFGLGFMQERALLAGGEFRVQSEPGQGTRIIIRVPLRAIIPGENP
ncbi:MAG: histidine kinase N-terminal 7TM domain-containing protein [Chloroflexota bacterium]